MTRIDTYVPQHHAVIITEGGHGWVGSIGCSTCVGIVCRNKDASKYIVCHFDAQTNIRRAHGQ